jgi:SAM-dependent methyltransferase
MAGEELAAKAAKFGKEAAQRLFQGQWGHGQTPEWYDHRLHFLDPEHHFTDFWTTSADNVIRVLPLHGRLLDLCSGDGFYAYWFFRLRAEVVCVERNQEAFDFAIRHHSHPRIHYIFADVLTLVPESDYFDVVLIRGAIEHFSAEDQQKIFRLAKSALKPGGYFCGDTPANTAEDKLLASHECEWKDEAEMRQALSTTFENMETWFLDSETSLHDNDMGVRRTLFWRCRK